VSGDWSEESSPFVDSAQRPLVTDLDGTLIHGDLLWEGLLRIILRTPWRIGGLLLAFLSGPAALKGRVARDAWLDPASLPWNDTVVEYLVAEHKRGRRVWLATAADRRVAESVAAHLGIFERVFATSEGDNVKGARKRALLMQAAPGGFDYIGDSEADMPVFIAAHQAWTVGPAAELLAQRPDQNGAARMFPGTETTAPLWLSVLRLIRVHQWLKNGLVFVPLIAGHQWMDKDVLISTGAAFAAFCLVASAAYVLNDLVDMDHDRVHPRKRRRPIASGAVSLPVGLSLFALLVVGGGVIAVTLSLETATVVAGYFALTTGYSTILKRIALVDIVVLSVLYNIRILGGGVASGITLSYWLIGFGFFLFFALAVMKRVTEMRDLVARGESVAAGRGYRKGDDQLLLPLGISCSVTAAVVFGLYTTSDNVHEFYRNPGLLLLIVPLVLVWQCNLWLATIRNRMGDDPLVYAVRDPVTWLIAVFSAVVFVTAL